MCSSQFFKKFSNNGLVSKKKNKIFFYHFLGGGSRPKVIYITFFFESFPYTNFEVVNLIMLYFFQFLIKAIVSIGSKTMPPATALWVSLGLCVPLCIATKRCSSLLNLKPASRKNVCSLELNEMPRLTRSMTSSCHVSRKTFSRLCTCPETDPILIWCRILKPYLVPLKRVCPPPQSRRAVPGEWKLHFILPITCQTDFKIYHVAVFQGTFRCPSLPCRSRSKLWIIL